MMSGRSDRYPFTASQWQELEHQALIFKYMASGAPVPHELILPLRRSFFPDPPPPAQFFPHQSSLGWSCFQMGVGRKTEDPEPGRCRRTDGKKWRCSKEAFPDSKYCERHMHRGKNRSRKPVEISLPANSSIAAPLSSSLYPPPHLLHFAPADPTSPADNRNQRYFHGMMKREEDHHQDSGGGRGGSWRFTPLGMSSLGLPKEEEKRQHCFVLGADLKEEKASFPTTQLSISIPLAHRDFSLSHSRRDD